MSKDDRRFSNVDLQLPPEDFLIPHGRGGEKLLFSIIIPTFNYGHYIKRAIDSALAQEGDDFEVLVIDDGSTDNTREIVAGYGNHVRYYRQENHGPYRACALGYYRSRGEYLVVLDADDRLLPDALRWLRAAIQSDPQVRMVFGHHITVGSDGRRKEAPQQPTLGTPLQNFHDFLMGRISIKTGAAAIHCDVVKHLEQYREPVRHGMEMVVIAHALLLFPCRAIKHSLFEMHDHKGRLRYNIESIRQAGTAVVDAVFNHDFVPVETVPYRTKLLARLQQSRAHSFYGAGYYGEACRWYRQAVHTDWRTLTCLRNYRRFLISLLLWNLALAQDVARRWLAVAADSPPGLLLEDAAGNVIWSAP